MMPETMITGGVHMRFVLTALIFLFGLFDLMIGLSFLLNPAETAVGFGIWPMAFRDFRPFALISLPSLAWSQSA